VTVIRLLVWLLALLQRWEMVLADALLPEVELPGPLTDQFAIDWTQLDGIGADDGWEHWLAKLTADPLCQKASA
jgi:hypothetical protein